MLDLWERARNKVDEIQYVRYTSQDKVILRSPLSHLATDFAVTSEGGRPADTQTW